MEPAGADMHMCATCTAVQQGDAQPPSKEARAYLLDRDVLSAWKGCQVPYICTHRLPPRKVILLGSPPESCMCAHT